MEEISLFHEYFLGYPFTIKNLVLHCIYKHNTASSTVFEKKHVSLQLRCPLRRPPEISRRWKPTQSRGRGKGDQQPLHSGRPTWQWKIHPLRMYFLLKMGIFHCHVSLPKGTFWLKNNRFYDGFPLFFDFNFSHWKVVLSMIFWLKSPKRWRRFEREKSHRHPTKQGFSAKWYPYIQMNHSPKEAEWIFTFSKSIVLQLNLPQFIQMTDFSNVWRIWIWSLKGFDFFGCWLVGD